MTDERKHDRNKRKAKRKAGKAAIKTVKPAISKARKSKRVRTKDRNSWDISSLPYAGGVAFGRVKKRNPKCPNCGGKLRSSAVYCSAVIASSKYGPAKRIAGQTEGVLGDMICENGCKNVTIVFPAESERLVYVP